MARNLIKEWLGDLIKQDQVVIYILCIREKHTLQLSVTWHLVTHKKRKKADWKLFLHFSLNVLHVKIILIILMLTKIILNFIKQS